MSVGSLSHLNVLYPNLLLDVSVHNRAEKWEVVSSPMSSDGANTRYSYSKTRCYQRGSFRYPISQINLVYLGMRMTLLRDNDIA